MAPITCSRNIAENTWYLAIFNEFDSYVVCTRNKFTEYLLIQHYLQYSQKINLRTELFPSLNYFVNLQVLDIFHNIRSYARDTVMYVMTGIPNLIVLWILNPGTFISKAVSQNDIL